MELTLQLSLLFFIVFALYTFSGLYILRLNPSSALNRTFFAVTAALSLWSFSFSIANSAADPDTVFLWRRIAAIGWGTLYSFLLHFIIILTGNGSLLKKRINQILLYLPACVCVFVFSINRDVAVLQYNIVKTTAGWANIPVNGVWDLVFNCYYIGYMIIGIGLLIRWGKNTSAPEKKKQSYLLVASFFISFILGSMTDILFNVYLKDAIPQVAPVIILIPISAIFYAIGRYALLKPESIDQVAEAGSILSKSSRAKVYHLLSSGYLLGSMLSFASQYFLYQTPLV